MAKYDVTYTCGHDGVANIVGPEKDRPRKLDWLETQKCPDCKKQSEQDAAKAYAEEKHLPALAQGSEKQIEWAERIRYRLLSDAHAYMLTPEIVKADEVTKKYLTQALRKLSIQSKAAWWINQDTSEGRVLIRRWAKEAYLKDASTKQE
jgi:hypothetical protein